MLSTTRCTWTNGLFLMILGGPAPTTLARLVRLAALLMIFTCQWCSSDFNVVIPELCSLPPPLRLNMTWVRETVLLGIPQDHNQNKISLNIFGADEICDWSEGLLKVMSAAHADHSGHVIASLDKHLCPTAQTFFNLRQRRFISWTCSQGPGVLSLKPLTNDIVIGVQRLVKYFNWRRVGFTKSRLDPSPFCEELGAQLQQFFDVLHTAEDNVSLIILGDLEHLPATTAGTTPHLRTSSSASSASSASSSANNNNLDSIFLCLSYHSILKNYLALNASLLGGGGGGGRRTTPPIVLIPEWPTPINIFIPKYPNPTYALVPIPRPSSSSSYAASSWTAHLESELSKPGLGIRESPTNRMEKLMETLLAHLVLQSVMVGVQEEIGGTATGSQWESTSWSPNGGSSGGSGGSRQHQSPNNNNVNSKLLPFYFSVLQSDKGRWHPLINLSSNGEGGLEGHSATAAGAEDSTNPEKPGAGADTFSKTHHHKNNESDVETEEWVTWVQVLIATSAASAVILSVICVSLYARKRSRDSLYGSTTRRKLSRRLRSQGPYKVLLTSKDIAFGTIAPTVEANSKKICSRAQFGGGGNGGGGGSQSHRGSEDRPDLLRESHTHGAGLRKNPSSLKVETNLTGEHRGARYKGDLVHLKEIPSFSEPLQVKMKAMTILETLHGLRHENLAAMLGCLTEISPGLVWEFCSRGSLYDILQQSDIKLDWAFKLSLLTDLVRGMRYLHLSMVRVHGCLNSFNCVVDARWVLKITNYGINGMMQAQGLPPLDRNSEELLWVAPELLRDDSLRKHGTQPGDVYSFAIIMQEVLVRGKPYSMLTLSAEEILEKVRRPPPLIRPSVSKGAAPPEAINIMRQCWAELPDMRPDFMVIHDLFKTLNHGRKANIVDTMFQMLEKYSNNLEELIRERTEQLDLERKKTEQLLNRMLPSTVAEKLKMGLPVDPEEFSQVTIYFSDIVGFTTISAYSTPFEVVDLLNDLYTCFDATINDYNVYKVETIGDAYMVVGGAPIWSMDHADQIATMALDLLHQSGKFRIRHLPFTPLRLRIGLHTGPCCAGVVGLTMPRYCLFGDTVNTASRMESTGSAWRIHISRETKAKLDSIGGYIIQYRGMTDIKGKGQLETFWLLGKEGFDKELPKPPGPNESVQLDEKSIIYGRTGKMPDTETIRGNEFGENTTTITSGSNLALPAKAQPKYCVLSGDNLRCLSPAEQVAYQLLNGKPVARGLRRQFSLDQGANAHPLVSMRSFRKAPSLEDTSEQYPSSSSTTTASLDFSQDVNSSTSSSSSATTVLLAAALSPTNGKQNQNLDKVSPTLVTATASATPEPTSPSSASSPKSSQIFSDNKTSGLRVSVAAAGAGASSGSTRISNNNIPTVSTNPSLPVLEESPLAARRGRRLVSTSLDT